ncbi:uncharacterized protein LOC132533095 [Erinaceus europaeus]|uniref:Uncharacterized protein LOC132533095 n=1 Tax=Erinaceus europaeus TaxID=9365 RepID=A0ABM3VX83_ERIEU|nr:uncharacterized protein LOC132533095 [Erinaceus europaeus]
MDAAHLAAAETVGTHAFQQVDSEKQVENKRRPCLDRCQHFFWVGVFLDMVGSVVLGMGIFAQVQCSDMLLYLGSIIIFLSLLCWFFWYTGNIEVDPEDVLKKSPFVLSPSIVDTLNPSFSHRFSCTFRDFSATLMRLRQPRQQRQRRSRRSTTNLLRESLNTITMVINQLEQGEEEEGQDREGKGPILQGSDIQDEGRKAWAYQPEAARSLKIVGTPRSDAVYVTPEHGVTRFTREPLSQQVQSDSTWPVAQPLPFSLRASVSLPTFSLDSTSPPVTLVTYKSTVLSPKADSSQAAACLASTSQPLHLLCSSLPTVRLSSLTRPLSQPTLSVDQSLLFTTPQYRLQESLHLQSQLQPTVVQAHQSHFVPDMFSVLHFLPPFQSKDITPSVSQAAQDFQNHFIYSRECIRRRTAVQEIALSSSSSIDMPQKPKAQFLKNLPGVRQDPSDDKENPLPESSSSGTGIQKTVPPKSGPRHTP